MVHQNCPSNDAYNETTTLTLANDSLNVSSFAIYQNADITGINMNSDQTNKSMNTTPPTQVTSMRFGPRNNFGKAFITWFYIVIKWFCTIEK